jgi:hypothetical protein
MSSDNNRLRVILLTHGGAEHLLKNLSEVDGVEIAGVFIETETSRRGYCPRERLRRSLRYEGYIATAVNGLRLLARRNGLSAGAADQMRDGQRTLGEFAESRFGERCFSRLVYS